MIVRESFSSPSPTTSFRHTESDIVFLMNGNSLYERYDVMYKGKTIGETSLRRGLFSVSPGLDKPYIATYIPGSGDVRENKNNYFYSQFEREKYLEMAAVAYVKDHPSLASSKSLKPSGTWVLEL